MGTNRFKYYAQDRFDGGIEERETVARPNQLKDARNVWVVDGSDELVTRPGYTYVTGAQLIDFEASSGRSVSCVVENPINTFTVTNSLSSLPSSARVYLGFAAKNNSVAVSAGIATANTNAAVMRWEYWNGSEWAPLTLHMLRQRSAQSSEYTNTTENLKFLGDTTDDAILAFAAPNDWASSTVGGVTGYFIRAKQTTNVTLSASTAFDGDFNEFPETNPAGDYPPSQYYFYGVVDYGSGLVALGFSDVYLMLNSIQDEAVGLALTVSAGRTGHKQLDTAATRYVSASEAISSVAGTTYKQRAQLGGEPPTIAVIPQVSEVFVAFRGHVYNISPTRLKPYTTLVAEDPTVSASATGVLRNYFDAKVENDPAFIGDALSPLNKDTVPQLDVFPQASSILYNNNLLWATRIEGEDGVVRWSAPAIAGVYLGYKVWPKINFAVLPSNQRATAQAALHEQTIVMSERTIFGMVAAATDTNNFTSYAPTRICDVGCLAQSSVQNIPGRLCLFANEGIFAFDGTPNIRRISDPINDIVARVNLGRIANCVSAHWDFYNMYVLAVPLDGAVTNNTLLLYDYERQAWWVWDNINARSMYVLDNELHFMDYYGNTYKFEGTHDYGTPIDSYATTHRFGKSERMAKTARDVRVTAYGQGVTAQLIAGDRDQASASISLGSSDDAVWDTAVWNTATWPDDNIKERRIGVRQAGRWFQLKVASSSKHVPLRINELAIGYITEGRR